MRYEIQTFLSHNGISLDVKYAISWINIPTAISVRRCKAAQRVSYRIVFLTTDTPDDRFISLETILLHFNIDAKSAALSVAIS